MVTNNASLSNSDLVYSLGLTSQNLIVLQHDDLTNTDFLFYLNNMICIQLFFQ